MKPLLTLLILATIATVSAQDCERKVSPADIYIRSLQESAAATRESNARNIVDGKARLERFNEAYAADFQARQAAFQAHQDAQAIIDAIKGK